MPRPRRENAVSKPAGSLNARRTYHLRIVLDFIAVGLLIACLAYWWLDNLSHELIGTSLFALIIIHNVFNGRRYGSIRKSSRDAAGAVSIAAIMCLAVVMSILLASSLLISRDLFAFMTLGDAIPVRSVHMFAAYWAVFIVAIHLGTRWKTILNVCRGAFGITGYNGIRTAMLRTLAFAIAARGVQSSFEMAFGSKLAFVVTLDMWDFNESTIGFFLNYLSIMGLYVVLIHYLLEWIRTSNRAGSRHGLQQLSWSQAHEEG